MKTLLLLLILPLCAVAQQPSPKSAPIPQASPEKPVLADPTNANRFWILGKSGETIRLDNLRIQWAEGIQGYNFERGNFELSAADLHESTRRHFKMGEFAPPPTAEELERQEKLRIVMESRVVDAEVIRSANAAKAAQIAADNATAARQQRELAAAQRAQASAAAASSPLANFQRVLAQQPQPVPSTEITVKSPALDAIAEQMRLDRVRQQVQQARKENRPYYVSPADARALGF